MIYPVEYGMTLSTALLGLTLSFAQNNQVLNQVGMQAIPLPEAKAVNKGSFLKLEPGTCYLVEFWATWCGPCREAIPHLNELSKKFSGPKMKFFAVSDESPELQKKFTAKYPMEANLLFDAGFKYANLYGANMLPTTILIDGNGKIAAYTRPDKVKDETIKDLIAGKPIKIEETKNLAPSFNWNKEISDSSISHFLLQEDTNRDFSFTRVDPVSGALSGVGLDLNSLLRFGIGRSKFLSEIKLDEDNLRYRVSVKAPKQNVGSAKRMLLNGLLEHFNLQIRKEKRSILTFILTKLPSQASNSWSKSLSDKNGGSARPGQINWVGMTVDQFAEQIGFHGFETHFENRTQSTEKFDVDLKWTPEDREEVSTTLRKLGFEFKIESVPAEVWIVEPRKE